MTYRQGGPNHGLRCNVHARNIGEYWTCSSGDTLADRNRNRSRNKKLKCRRRTTRRAVSLEDACRNRVAFYLNITAQGASNLCQWRRQDLEVGGRAFQFWKKVSIRFDSRYRIDLFDSIRLGNLINLPLVH